MNEAVTSLARWQEMWRELGASASDDALFSRLMECYSEPHRKYHTMQHLNECLAHLESVRSFAERPEAQARSNIAQSLARLAPSL